MISRKRVWEIVGVAKGEDRSSRLFDFVILTLIFLSVGAIILESVDPWRLRFSVAFDLFEVLCITLFSLEYSFRIWACTADPRYSHPIRGRLRFACTPLAIVDLLAILPFFLSGSKIDMRVIRVLRVFRLFRLAKLARYSKSLQLIANVVKRSRYELAVTIVVIGVLTVIASCLMYYVEHAAQPERFADIPSTMWWAVITLTTVGYGDIYPITFLGKALAAGIAILGVGLLALPTAILGSAFVDEIGKKKRPCPHCNRSIDGDRDDH